MGVPARFSEFAKTKILENLGEIIFGKTIYFFSKFAKPNLEKIDEKRDLETSANTPPLKSKKSVTRS